MSVLVVEWSWRAHHVRGLPTGLRPLVVDALAQLGALGLPPRDAAERLAEGLRRALRRTGGYTSVRVEVRPALEELCREARGGELPADLVAAFDRCRDHTARGVEGARLRLTRADLRTYDPRTGCSVCALAAAGGSG